MGKSLPGHAGFLLVGELASIGTHSGLERTGKFIRSPASQIATGGDVGAIGNLGLVVNTGEVGRVAGFADLDIDQVFAISGGGADCGGKSTYLEPNWPEPLGNHEFLVYVEDHNEPGVSFDQFWIEVHDREWDVIAIMSMDREAIDHTVTLGVGNLVVPHDGASRRRY